VGDSIIVDGGMVELQVVSKAGPDVAARCLERGLILSRANLTFRWGEGGGRGGGRERGREGLRAGRNRGCNNGMAAERQCGELKCSMWCTGKGCMHSRPAEPPTLHSLQSPCPSPIPHPSRRKGDLIRGRLALLPVVSAKDWRDIDWALAQEVDFLAISFVRSADVIQNLRWGGGGGGTGEGGGGR
jgi:hypothetical protein